jgi:hypothetical protein
LIPLLVLHVLIIHKIAGKKYVDKVPVINLYFCVYFGF